jgi:hypothetical protein
MEQAIKDYHALVKSEARLCLSNVGHRAVDLCTYAERLKASKRGRRPPVEWLEDPDRRQQLEDKAKHHGQQIRHIIGLYGGLVSSFRPIFAKYLCQRYGGTSVVDISAGWGGRLLGVVSCGSKYIGIDTNKELACGYDKLKQITGGDVTMLWQPAETVDFSSLGYDMILSCPPYAEKEHYPHMPQYRDWLKEFLIPVTRRAYDGLKLDGSMVLCIPEPLADAISREIGQADEFVDLPIRARKKGLTSRTERAYCWNKKSE